MSIGISFCCFPPLVAGWSWLPERKGLVTGLVVSALGTGSFFFSLLSLKVVNPTNEVPTVHAADGSIYFDESVAARVPLLM